MSGFFSLFAGSGIFLFRIPQLNSFHHRAAFFLRIFCVPCEVFRLGLYASVLNGIPIGSVRARMAFKDRRFRRAGLRNPLQVGRPFHFDILVSLRFLADFIDSLENRVFFVGGKSTLHRNKHFAFRRLRHRRFALRSKGRKRKAHQQRRRQNQSPCAFPNVFLFHRSIPHICHPEKGILLYPYYTVSNGLMSSILTKLKTFLKKFR